MVFLGEVSGSWILWEFCLWTILALGLGFYLGRQKARANHAAQRAKAKVFSTASTATATTTTAGGAITSDGSANPLHNHSVNTNSKLRTASVPISSSSSSALQPVVSRASTVGGQSTLRRRHPPSNQNSPPPTTLGSAPGASTRHFSPSRSQSGLGYGRDGTLNSSNGSGGRYLAVNGSGGRQRDRERKELSISRSHSRLRSASNAPVLALLASVDCSQYKDALESNGVDSLLDIKLLKAEGLCSLGVKKAHAERIMAAAEGTIDTQSFFKRPDTTSDRFVDTSNDSLVDLPALSGFLQKKASNNKLAGWQKRYFRVDGPFIKYYREKDSSKISAAIDLRQVFGIGMRPDEQDACFEVMVNARTLLLLAESKEDAERWVEGLLTRQRRLWGIKDPQEEYEEANLDNSLPDNHVEEDLDVPAMRARGDSVLTELGCTEEEKEQVKLLREAMADKADQIDEGMLIRFVRARAPDLAEAESFLRKHLEWREQNLPIDGESVRAELAKGKYMLTGVDKLGNPLVLINNSALGKHTYTDFPESMRAIIYALEAVCNQKLGPTGRFTVIFSRVDATMKNVDMDWTQGVGKLLQDNYPERLQSALIVPCNFAFRGIWNIAKHFFDPKTANKVQCLADPSALLEYIEPAYLLKELGGTLTVEGFDVDSILDPIGYAARTAASSASSPPSAV